MYVYSFCAIFLIYLLIYLFRWSLALLPMLKCSGMISAQCNLWLSGSNDFPASASGVAGIIDMHLQAQLIFVSLVATGFHHVSQAGLELLTSGYLPTSASQGAGITGVSHLAWLRLSLEIKPTMENPRSTWSFLPSRWLLGYMSTFS